jgi:hypothetical protein
VGFCRADRVIPEVPIRIPFGREPLARPRRAEVPVLCEQLGQLAVEIGIGGLAREDLAGQRDRASPLPAASPVLPHLVADTTRSDRLVAFQPGVGGGIGRKVPA